MAKRQEGSARRFGSRYGRTVRDRVGKVEKLQHKSYACPYCHYERARREAVGIWNCSKCGAKFTAKAYMVG